MQHHAEILTAFLISRIVLSIHMCDTQSKDLLTVRTVYYAVKKEKENVGVFDHWDEVCDFASSTS